MDSFSSMFERARKGFARTAVASSAPLAVVVVIGAFVSFRSHTILRQDRDMVVHTYQVIEAVRETLLLAEEAEAAQGIFVVTGDSEVLKRYEQARTQLLPATFRDLDRLLIQNRDQQARFARLRAAVQQKFSSIQAVIDARRSQGFQAAQQLIQAHRDRQKIDEIRTLVSEMDSVEERLLTERAGRAAASERRILLVGAGIATLSVLVRLFIVIRATRGRALPAVPVPQSQ